MPAFASDSFSSANGTELSAHNPAWKKVTGFSASAQIANGRARASSTSSTMYYYDASPGSADYSVSADCTRISTLNSVLALTLRSAANAANCYRLYPEPVNGTFILGSFVAGSYAELGASTSQIAVGETANIRFEVTGSSSSGGTVLRAYKNGSGTHFLSRTDSTASLDGAGFAGVRSFSAVAPSDTGGVHLDNFLAATPDAPAPTITSITASNITSSGARITLGLTR